MSSPACLSVMIVVATLSGTAVAALLAGCGGAATDASTNPTTPAAAVASAGPSPVVDVTPPPTEAAGGPSAEPATSATPATPPADAGTRGEDDTATIGESFGAGGLGLQGIGEGGGGRGEGIGIGNVGSIGHGAGTGTGQGFGSGSGRLGGAHTRKPPQIRMGAVVVNGPLPPEIIQRIVRQNFGRFRLCYENGLRKKPSLQGRVAVKFTVGLDGSTKSPSNAGSDLPDASVVSCVVRAFAGISYPQPDGKEVVVVYPMMMSPGNPPPPEATPAAPKPAAPPAKPAAPH